MPIDTGSGPVSASHLEIPKSSLDRFPGSDFSWRFPQLGNKGRASTQQT